MKPTTKAPAEQHAARSAVIAATKVHRECQRRWSDALAAQDAAWRAMADSAKQLDAALDALEGK